MWSKTQEELFSGEHYTRLCSICRGEFPRSIEFFPAGRCKDKMATFCRKCSIIVDQSKNSTKKILGSSSGLCLPKKICENCGDLKTLREFYMSSYSFDGKTKDCKS